MTYFTRGLDLGMRLGQLFVEQNQKVVAALIVNAAAITLGQQARIHDRNGRVQHGICHQAVTLKAIARRLRHRAFL
jgi:hypothetical protein